MNIRLYWKKGGVLSKMVSGMAGLISLLEWLNRQQCYKLSDIKRIEVEK